MVTGPTLVGAWLNTLLGPEGSAVRDVCPGWVFCTVCWCLPSPERMGAGCGAVAVMAVAVWLVVCEGVGGVVV